MDQKAIVAKVAKASRDLGEGGKKEGKKQGLETEENTSDRYKVVKITLVESGPRRITNRGGNWGGKPGRYVLNEQE